jgi:hypothetical protein
MRYLHETYSVERQMQGYADAILKATKRPPMGFRPAPLTKESRFVLAPWCYVWDENIYHDFDARHRLRPQLVNLLAQEPAGFTQAQAAGHGISEDEIRDWYRDGYIVPAYEKL